MKNAIAYIRVSRQTDVSSIHSVETQKSMIQSFADRNGIEILEWFEDVNVSGGKSNRVNLSKAVSLAKRTNSYILVRDLTRLSRKASECLRLLSECDVIDSTLGIEADPKILGLMSLFGQWEREACSVRQKQTIAYLRKQDPSRKFGNPKSLEIGRVTSSQNRSSAADEFAMKLAPLVMTEETLQVIALKLMSIGIKTRRGGDVWSPKTVRSLRLRIERLSNL
jgi:DNA invertase Pin-like site-specific DNA recombinase